MATNDSIQGNPDLIDTGDQLIMSAPRATAAIDAAIEIEQLAKVLITLSVQSDNVAVRGVSVRVKQLADSIIAAMADEIHATEDIYFDVLQRRVDA